MRSAYSEASSTSDGTNTTQVFFDQSLVDKLATTVAPYSAEGTNPTTNAGDRVYALAARRNRASVVNSDGDSPRPRRSSSPYWIVRVRVMSGRF